MGMDVHGKRPTSTAGEYFRNTVSGWHPLWDYCVHVAPDIAGKLKYGHSNDGDGLGARDSRKLTERLRAEIESGRTTAYATAREQELAALPDEPCEVCSGVGRRLVPQVGGQPGPEGIMCDACDGKGKVRPFAAYNAFSEENVREFAAFLADCGGFSIW